MQHWLPVQQHLFSSEFRSAKLGSQAEQPVTVVAETVDAPVYTPGVKIQLLELSVLRANDPIAASESLCAPAKRRSAERRHGKTASKSWLLQVALFIATGARTGPNEHGAERPAFSKVS